MKNPLSLSRVLLGAVLISGATLPGVAAENVFKFSDPAKPGRIIVQTGFGDVSVVGGDTKEVRVSSDVDIQGDAETLDNGFRRLDGGSGFSAAEANNVITITAASMFPGKGGRHGDDSDVAIVVPRQTSVTIERRGPGDMEVRDVTGDLEIRGAIGDIELSGMGGGVLIESINGDVEASLAALVAGKPVSISVVHGDVEVTIPADARANVELRTLQGEMLTNFSKEQLTTRLEDGGVAGGEVNVNVNVDAPVKVEMADAERAQRDAEKARKQAEKDAKRAAEAAAAHPGHFAVPPIPPLPPMPPMPGGKRVVGALNGGGTELTVVTITGDITLQKAE